MREAQSHISFDEVERDFISGIIEDFESRAEKGAWMASVEEDGSFEVYKREKLRDMYIENRLAGEDAEYMVINFRGFPTFSEAKSYVVCFLTGWSEEIRDGARAARKLRKRDLA